ncbi:hypothetical protein ER308_12295 [Egibacter rhizosphaerae]|uniref:Asparagine synthetase domain-containing protein n=1 Tax=Egibacter rhizosphaerae TaxID=1670831 RepID=A0A411YGG7_9ACTN|nr:asparagine synthase-related protein [Egibacter rhizosphaerae]QBI20269.1 hypothetical protein ER308_12295 [Egibacter rhizosphaerae]
MRAHDQLVRMTPQEIATGWPTGREPVSVPDPRLAHRPPREVLEALILPALTEQPCLVGFSGGRDSSAVLAVATDLARSRGLPDPVPMTRRYPGDALADEDAWQELVIRHLGLTEWERIDVIDELDLLGERAIAALRRYGQLWPPMHYVNLWMLDHARGGAYLTGQGGDEVLGSHRLAPIRAVAGQGLRVNRRTLRRAAGAAAPNRVRGWWARRRPDPSVAPPWLRAELATAHHAAVLADHAKEPLRADRSIRWQLGFRAVGMAFRNLDLLAAERDVRVRHPLLDPSFAAAMGRTWGWRGPRDRTEALRWLVGDLLPEAVCARLSKAAFNTALFGPASRAFVEQWDGSGVDTTLVDPEELRQTWTSDFPHGGSFALLQQAWLHQDGR